MVLRPKNGPLIKSVGGIKTREGVSEDDLIVWKRINEQKYSYKARCDEWTDFKVMVNSRYYLFNTYCVVGMIMIRYIPLLAQFYRPESEGRLTRDELRGQS